MFESGILHTIFFHRALGLVRPRDVDCELFELTYVSSFINLSNLCNLFYYEKFYCSLLLVNVVIVMKVQCGVAEVEKEIEEKINEFITKVSKHPNRRNQVLIFKSID